MTDFNWTDDRVAKCKRLYIEEGKSAAETARSLGAGCTRNSVIGKATRMGWLLKGRQPAAAPALKAPAVARNLHVGRIGDRFKAKAPKPAEQSPFGRATTAAEAAQKRIDAQKAGLTTILKAVEAANDDAVRLIDRRAFQCSWPVGEPDRPADQLCCGQPVIGERTKSTATYCDRHRMRASPAGVPSVRDLARSVRRAA